MATRKMRTRDGVWTVEAIMRDMCDGRGPRQYLRVSGPGAPLYLDNIEDVAAAVPLHLLEPL